jgi:hypothetical protein
MGYLFVMGPCYVCGLVMTYNPIRVPSIPIGPDGKPAVGGRREPICALCIERGNPYRVEAGLEPIVPHPDAYEPEPEENVPYED